MGSFSPHPHQNTLCVFDNSHSDRCDGGYLILVFFDYQWSWASFHVSTGRLYIFFKKHLFKSSAYFLIWFCFLFIFNTELWGLCIFWILIPLLDAQLASIFSHSVGCLFISLIAPFTVQKPSSLSPVCLSWLLSPLPGKTEPEKNRWDWCQRVCCLRFLLGVLRLQFLHLNFHSFWVYFHVWCEKVSLISSLFARVVWESLTHFELVSTHGVRKWSSLSHLHVAV